MIAIEIAMTMNGITADCTTVIWALDYGRKGHRLLGPTSRLLASGTNKRTKMVEEQLSDASSEQILYSEYTWRH